MGIVFIESFDGFHQTDGQPINTGSTFATKWAVDIGTAELTQPGRDIGKACGLSDFARITRDLATIETVIVGFALKLVTVASECGLMLPRFNTNTNRSQLILNADRTFSVRRGSTVLATTEDVFALDAWYYVEFKTKITETAGSYELRVNGIQLLSDPNVSMDNTGTPGTNNISFGAASGSEVHIDDVYILDCDTAGRDTFCGPIKVHHRRPVDVFENTGWTANTGTEWEAVNEAPPDGDTTYVETSTSGAVIQF